MEGTDQCRGCFSRIARKKEGDSGTDVSLSCPIEKLKALPVNCPTKLKHSFTNSLLKESERQFIKEASQCIEDLETICAFFPKRHNAELLAKAKKYSKHVQGLDNELIKLMKEEVRLKDSIPTDRYRMRPNMSIKLEAHVKENIKNFRLKLVASPTRPIGDNGLVV
eukprot:TRINITY_DN7167_c0_g1_i3.p1 TRINITY_DN7167_c0_g1~~TRINITY_DN7167_c0_g1_i3.p1  ORF type:complete len:166 (+),score=31.77 TRINITY_DN7167_c0_g1_i3:387-884(+)